MMTMTMTILKTYLHLAAFLIAAIAVWALLGLFVSDGLRLPVFAALFFAVAALVKWRVPHLLAVRRHSWTELVLTAVAAIAAALLVSNSHWLGGWTVIAVAVLFLLYAGLRFALVLRRGDGRLGCR